MSSAEDYLPQVDTIKVYIDDIEASGGSQYSVGDGILTDNDVWYDDSDEPLYTMLDAETEFSATDYPLLAEVYPTLVTPSVPDITGSVVSVRIAGDYNE